MKITFEIIEGIYNKETRCEKYIIEINNKRTGHVKYDRNSRLYTFHPNLSGYDQEDLNFDDIAEIAFILVEKFRKNIY